MRAKKRSTIPTATCWLWLACLFPNASSLAQVDEPSEAARSDSSRTQQLEFFEAKIRPVLVERCYECHAADSKIVRGGLQLDSRQAGLQGGDSGPAIVPGQPEDSLLIEALRHDSLEMPPDEKLPAQVIADFEEWIRHGAIDPRDEVLAGRLQPVDWEAAAKHWAFQPLSDPLPPVIEGLPVESSPIDRFILKELQAVGWEPAAAADKRTLIRRATYDLTGLPPTVDEVNAFLADTASDSFARLVDRLLESPRYGERWGRHWLDLVRYATSNGADENHELPNAWRYRDWVVRMFNQDLRLDQFIVQQLAGDLLPVPDDEQLAGELLTATGMLVIGPKMLAEQDKDKMTIDIVDEQIDTVARTMLGLTVACARCHDHKFDPISASDYYAMAGIFYSTKTMANRDFVSQWMERPLPSKAIEQQRAEHQLKIDAAKSQLAAFQSPADDEAIKTQNVSIEQLEKEMPPFEMVMATEEAEPQNLPVHIRGNHLQPGSEVIPRGVPVILTRSVTAPEIPSASSGRLQFAQWLVAPEHPLTARVMMNRVWMWHFGEPLMRTPSNWGLQAEPPTHPELLDWLAQELIRSGWSLKAMHRTIMLSATYQMSSRIRADYQEQDPENRRWSRQNRRRLEAEPVRDALLFVGGGLDQTMGNIAADVAAKRRAIYLPVNRAALYEMFSTFDYVETGNHLERRPVTTVPNQALFLMNSDIVHEQARRLVERLVQENARRAADSDTPPTELSTLANLDTQLELQAPQHRVSELFEHLFARSASTAEVARALQFVEAVEAKLSALEDPRERQLQAWSALCRTLMASNEFIYVE